MPLISGAASSFNGGTITQPLVIATTDGNVIPLKIVASWNAQNQDFFQVVNGDTGTRMLAVDVSGNVIAFRHTSEASINLKSDGGQVYGALPAVEGSGAIGSRTLGLYDHSPAAQPVLASGTATPEQIALALQSYGAAGGT
jgi:hypothetical protein